MDEPKVDARHRIDVRIEVDGRHFQTIEFPISDSVFADRTEVDLVNYVLELLGTIQLGGARA